MFQNWGYRAPGGMICHEVVNTTPQNDQTGLGVRGGGKDLFCCIPIANSKFYGRRVWCTVLLKTQSELFAEMIFLPLPFPTYG